VEHPHPMALLCPVVIILAAAAVLLGASWGRGGGQIYNLSQVEAGLKRDPHAWLGRTVLLHAVVIVPSTPCSRGGKDPCGRLLYLMDDPALFGRVESSLFLLRLESDPLLDRLRGLPGVSGLLPSPQDLTGSTFRVRIQLSSAAYLCPLGGCYEAALLDAGAVIVQVPGPGPD
jgi:hypothetical protein